MITPSFGLTATERVLPKLALDFTTASLDPRVTFTRTGNTATVVNSSGYIAGINANLPRFDFDPVTLACKGLLIEEARANILRYNNDFTTGLTAWSSSATLTANAATGPDNTSSATKIVRAGASYTFQQFSTTAGSYTFSVYLKANNTSACVLTLGDLAGTLGANGTVNLIAKTITVANIGATTGSTGTIIDAGNGWFRCTLTTTLTTIATSIANIGSSGAIDIFVDFPQVEAGAFATSYIPNPTITTTTRNADLAVMTGTNFSSWFNASEGTLKTTFTAGAVARSAIQMGENSSFNNRIYLSSSASNYVVSNAGGTNQVTLGSFTVSNTVFSTSMGSYKADNFSFCIDGGTVLTDTLGTVPAPSALSIGSRNPGTPSQFLCGIVKSFYYYPIKLTDAEMQAFSKG